MEFIELDPMIEMFIKDHFTHYMGREIKKSFTLFDNYGITDYQDYYLGLLPLQNVCDPQETIANVYAELHNELDYMLLVHGIVLIDQVRLHIKNNILEGMWLFIDALPEVKELHYNTLNDEFISPEEKFSIVIHEFVDSTQYELIEVIESVDASLIAKMLHLIENEEAILTSDPRSLEIYKQFDGFVKSHYKEYPVTIATSIVLSSFPLGLSVKDYIPFIVKALLKLKDSAILINLYSIYVISSNFLENDFVSTYAEFENFFKESHHESLPLSDEFLKLSNEFDIYRSNKQ